uniref:DNA-directed RNA polymerase n=1 Tax=viral metagenome TaxID=1070528 RepID=A0A6C0KWZ7_9ZZZZ
MIGDWIDSHLDNPENKADVKHYEDRQMELLNLKTKVYIPTADEKGNVSWGELTAVTRHDPGNELYEITTLGGRKITVTESKSMIIWDSGKKEFHEKPTSEVKLGDFTPVAAEILDPPIIVNEVDMSIYFPKNQYIHGTEFLKADKLMKEVMEEQNAKSKNNYAQIPRGWWDKTNGRAFTLPYPDKAKLQRAVSGRCDLQNIKEGVIYPYHASRQTSWLPDKFKLDYDNGIFIGLFLADGNAAIVEGHVTITKKDENVKQFIKNWFDKFNIKHVERTDKKISKNGKVEGTTTIVSGYTTLFAVFLHKIVGHMAQNKYVPDFAYNANNEFVNGLITGYFSGDGYVRQDGSIYVSSCSRKLIEGISFLCNRLGIFGKLSTTKKQSNNLETENILPMHHLAIRAQWAKKFAEQINLLVHEKNERLTTLKNNKHQIFQDYNNVVLDEIIEITKIGIEQHPKVYDVTVPSTLTFIVRNGVDSYDTSETGYIQRRLVKAMEDNKIYYDQTVRNATGAIVQYLYGEDGMDGTKIENQYIPYISMNLIEMDVAYNIRPEDPLDLHMTSEAIEEMRKDPSWMDKSKEYFNNIIEDRIYLITKIFKGEDNNKIQYPIPFERIIGNAIKRLNIVTKKSEVKSVDINGIVPTDLTPGHIYNTIDTLINKMKITQKDQGIRFLQILLRCYLSPKTLIFEHHMPLTLFNYVISEIEKAFIQSIAHAGEMVGIIAAQSIGELSTQQSVTGDTLVKIMHKNSKSDDILYSGEIGKFIDKLLQDNPKRVKICSGSRSESQYESVVLDLLPSIENYSIVSLTHDEKLKWSRISQISRHPVNGNLIKITTRSGRQVTATLAHSFLMRSCYGIYPIKGSLLKIGDRIPVAKFTPDTHNFPYSQELAEYKFSLPEPEDIIPNVHEIISTMRSSLVKEEEVYTRQNLVEIIHCAKNKTDNKILIKLLQQGIDSDVIYDEIISIETIEEDKSAQSKQYVYDFTVPGNESFMVNNGIMVHNTLDSFHSSGTAAAVKATSGVPRLKELLSVSKNIKTPTLVIYMKPDISVVVNPLENDDGKVVDSRVQDSKERSMKIMKQIEITCLSDILDNTEIYWDPPGNNGLHTGLTEDNAILDIYRAFSNIECQKNRSQSPWVLRMKLNKIKMYRIGITMLDIYTKINTMYNQSIDCIFSDDNAEELIFRIRLTKEVLKDIDPDDAIAALKAMEYNLTHNVLLKGLKGIKKVSMREKVRKQYNEENDVFEKVSEWILDTDGTNLIEILANTNIDAERTRSNDIYEILQVLGIEAARNALYQEFMEVTGEGAINYRHMSLLLDTMTNRGTLMSVDRHGINRGDVGPLAKCSFEETTDMLINASIFSELDNINGVSANIMLGQLPPCGTGDHEVLIDEKMYMDLLKENGTKKIKGITQTHPAVHTDIPTIYDEKPSCTIDNIALKFNMPSKKTKKKLPAPNVTFV